MSTGSISCPSKYIEWKFGDFSSQLKKEGNIILSPNFTFAGASWHLKIYPRVPDDDSGWISVYLVNACHLEICTSARIGIMKDDGTVYLSDEFDQHNFNSQSWCNGFEHFVHRSTLWTDMPEISPTDKVTFFCWIGSIDEGYTETKTQRSKLKGISKLSQDFEDLLLNGKDYDTTIKIEDREFQAHRLILKARSPVFAVMYSHDTTERSTGILEIEDCDAEAFEDFLIFLYSGKVESLSLENVFELYPVADKYDVQAVKQECRKCILNNLFVENFCDVMALAMKYSDSELLESATDFFVENARDIFVTSEWLDFHTYYPVKSNELCIKAFEFYVPY